MKRLTNEMVRVDERVDRFLGPLADLENMKPKLLDLVLNGPALNGVSKDVLRQIIRQLYSALAAYEGTGLEPEEVLPKDKADEIALKLMRLTDLESLCSYTRLRELAEADKDGRLVVLPCKVGDTVYRVFHGNPKNPVISSFKVNTVDAAVSLSRKMGRHKYISVFLAREEAEEAKKALEEGRI